jgi:hypothetical protein
MLSSACRHAEDDEDLETLLDVLHIPFHEVCHLERHFSHPSDIG